MTTERDTLARAVHAAHVTAGLVSSQEWEDTGYKADFLKVADALLAAGVRTGEAVSVLMHSLDMQQNATRGAVVRSERAEAELAEARAARDEWRASALDEAAHVESLRAVIAAVAALMDEWESPRRLPEAAHAASEVRAVLADPAAALAARDAEKWDEGYASIATQPQTIADVRNPYRADRIEGGA